MEKTRLLFVCLGNIVRSPLAENMFKHLADQSGKGDKYEVDSAGTGSWHIGETPDARMRKVAARRGFHYSGSARQIKFDDFQEFDWIIAMDPSNKANLLSMAQSGEAQKKIRLLREFDPEGGPDEAVPDPYYGGIDGFEMAYDLVERSCQGLLEALENGSINGEEENS